MVFRHSKILSIKQFSNVLRNLAKLVKLAKFFSRENYFPYGSLLSAKSYKKGKEKGSKFFQILMKFSMRSCQSSWTALRSINLHICFKKKNNICDGFFFSFCYSKPYLS